MPRSLPGRIVVPNCSGSLLGGTHHLLGICRLSLPCKKLGHTETLQTLKLKVVIKRLFELYLDTPDGVAFYGRIHIGRVVHVLDCNTGLLQISQGQRFKMVQNIGSNAALHLHNFGGDVQVVH